jgi:hypothetical protein
MKTNKTKYAICQDCKKEMVKFGFCNFKYIVDDKGTIFQRVRFDEARELPRGPCHDCNCKKGAFHHHGCDMEECPKCGGQLISCDCTWKELRIYKKI